MRPCKGNQRNREATDFHRHKTTWKGLCCFAFLFAAAVSGCNKQKASRPPEAATNASSPTESKISPRVQALMKKEALESLLPLSVEAKGYRAKALGVSVGGYTDDGDGIKTFAVTLHHAKEMIRGQSSPEIAMECALSPNDVFLANTIHTIAHNLLTGNEKIESGKLIQSEFYALSPRTAVNRSQVIYDFKDRSKGRVIGILHIGVAKTPDWSLWCIFDNPGYSKTFKKSFDKIARTLEVDFEKEEKTGENQLYLLRVKGHTVGLIHEWESVADGFVLQHAESSVLGGDLTKQGIELQTLYRASGFRDNVMTYGHVLKTMGDKDLVDIELIRDDKSYEIAGNAADKVIEAQATPKHEVTSNREIQACIQALFEDPAQKSCKSHSWEEKNGRVLFQSQNSTVLDRAKRTIRSASLLSQVESELDESYRAKRAVIETQVDGKTIAIEMLRVE